MSPQQTQPNTADLNAQSARPASKNVQFPMRMDSTSRQQLDALAVAENIEASQWLREAIQYHYEIGAELHELARHFDQAPGFVVHALVRKAFINNYTQRFAASAITANADPPAANGAVGEGAA